MTLRVLDSVLPVYSVPEDDLIGEVIVPGLAAAQTARCMFGFFDSAALKHVAPGLAAFLAARPEGTLQLIASPMLSASDLKAVQDAVERPEEILARAAGELLEGARLSTHALARFSHRCLAFLLASNRLDLRFAAVRSGLFHPKVWILCDGVESVVVHGSSNFTAPGLLYNFETVSVERSWREGDSGEKISRFTRMFERLWRREDPNAIVLDAPEAVRAGLLAENSPNAPPSLSDFFRAWDEDFHSGRETQRPPQPPADEPVVVEAKRLRIPAGLSFREGRFAHQGRAVAEWEDAGGRGILAMATGSGKTVSALVAATRLQDRAPRLLVVIAVPYRPLVKQWAFEVERFGVTPMVLGSATRSERSAYWIRTFRALELGASPVAVAVVTHDYLVSDEFMSLQSRMPNNVTALLIADEVHNLGRPKFVARQPSCFAMRLGLSATPERQYDQAGTDLLLKYFGPTVFEFALDDAIGTCLVPYDYEMRCVDLTSDELDEWERLTEELRRAGFGGAADAEDAGKLPIRIVRLLVKRRAVLESASNKLEALAHVLFEDGTNLRHTLIYATDKSPRQLEQVNDMLRDRGVLFHQITQAESGDRKRLSAILDSFAAGDLQVLTAKRVLDEGVDIPETKRAFLLASSTVRRQWIQRRGRVLRRCERLGKQKAHITDFLVIPPGGGDGVQRGILQQEIARAQEFARLADNAGDPGGPFDVIRELMP